jgi:hypothetical protein
VAHRASRVRLIHVSIRAAQRAATTAFMGQARPTDLRTMSCLGQANLCVPHAGPSDPAQNYRTMAAPAASQLCGLNSLRGAVF